MTHRNRFVAAALAAVVSLVATGCAPTPAFTADPTGGTRPLKVTFTDKSATLSWLRVDYSALAPIYGWEWDFGDGTGSTAQDVTHTYEVSGEYTVSLTVSNLFGTATVTKPGLVKVNAPSAAPTSRFEFAADAANPLVIKFTDKSTPGTRPITSWFWDFGDNSTSTEQSPTHTYAAAGIFKVSLTVQTVVGSDDSEQTVGVNQVLPTAAFRSQADSSNTLTIFFTDESVNGSQTITKWEWDFGDNASSTDRNPRHTYEEGGDYEVTLKVTTTAGADEETKTLTVVAPTTPTEGEVEGSS